MVFLDHVQNLNIRAEKTHKDFGAHCMKYVNFVHDPEKQYRSTVPAVRPLSIGLQVTEQVPEVTISTVPRRACEPPIRTCIVFLDHVQNLQIHAVRAKFY